MLREMNLAQFHFLKDQLIAFSPNDNGITRVKFPRKNTLCQTIFNTLLNGTFQWTRTIQWIEASLDQLIESTVIDRQTHIAFCQTLTQAVQLDIGNTANLVFFQRVEDHQLINTVDKFWTEMLRYCIHDYVTNFITGRPFSQLTNIL